MKTGGLLIGLVVSILVTIGGYVFLKNYEKYDTRILQRVNIGYRSFGKVEIILCMLLGAYFMIHDVILSRGTDSESHIIIAAAIVSYFIFDTIRRLKSRQQIIRKILWGSLSCGIEFLIGCLGAFALTAFLVLWALVVMIAGTIKMKRGKVTSEQIKQYNEEAETLEAEKMRLNARGKSDFEAEEYIDKVRQHNQKSPSDI